MAASSASVRSVRVLRADEPLFIEPTRNSDRRGSAALGALLRVYGVAHGGGCDGRWFSVGALAWLCEEGAAPLATAPPEAAPRPLTADGLPFEYYFVGRDGSFGYWDLEHAEEGAPEAQLQPGFGVAVRRRAQKPGGEHYGLTTHGFWFPMRDLGRVTPPVFHGTAWSDDRGAAKDAGVATQAPSVGPEAAGLATEAGAAAKAPGIGWVKSNTARRFARPLGASLPGALARRTAVRTLERRTAGGREFVRIGDSEWVAAADLVEPEVTNPPEAARAGERWLDVDTRRQILTAYVGARPVFATLVSTGRGARGTETATPPGLYRIWVKLVTSDMDNLENVEARENYAIEAVPWVMFFEKGYGLHGTFWHDRFGQPQSHGCVNLSPLDAERLFAWTAPRLPGGWTAALPTVYEPGTIVQVR